VRSNRPLRTHPGDVLVFLPGQREIAQVDAALAGSDAMRDIDVLALHGELPVEQQARVLRPPDGKRRVVLATNVAECQRHLPGVRVVIDSGLAREPRYDPNSGFARLDVVTIAQASADQRAGRAGRVAEGGRYRLWPQSQRSSRSAPRNRAGRTGLARARTRAWGSADLRFVDAPPPAHSPPRAICCVARVRSTRRDHPARPRMLALGTHPRLAAMLLARRATQERALACDLARAGRSARSVALAQRRTRRTLARPRRLPRGHATDGNRGAARRDRCRRETMAPSPASRCTRPARVDAHRLGDLLAHAFPDRIAHQHADAPRRYQLANGRMATLFDDSALFGEPWLVASELRFDAKDALLLRGAPVDETRLQRDFPERFIERDTVRWDADRRALVAQRERRFDHIVLDAAPPAASIPRRRARAHRRRARTRPRRAAVERIARTMARARPLPAHVVAGAKASRSVGRRAARHARRLAAARASPARRAWTHSRIELADCDSIREATGTSAAASTRLAPRASSCPPAWNAASTTPSMPRRRAPPVLAVKLQELFGLADTPRIVDGRVPLTLHLLSPGGARCRSRRTCAASGSARIPTCARK
jgi:ATP-dependent helicase HrpB